MLRLFRFFNPTKEAMETPSLKELAAFLRTKKAEKAELTKQHDTVVAEIDAIIEGIEELMLETFPEGVDTQSVTFDDGAKASITKKTNAQFRLNEGQSDQFYEWAKANGRTDLLQRRISQDAMKSEVQNQGLPPGVFVHTETVVGMTVRRAAPTV